MSTSPATLKADPTSLSAAQANILASSTAMVKRLNEDLITRYHMAYTDYVANMQSGENIPADRRVPPKPPMAWELAPPNESGFVFYQVGTTPVCDPGPTVNCNFDNPLPNKVPNVIMIGKNLGGKWFQALPGDTFPNGQTTPPITSADGVTGTFEKFGAPVGYGWYLQVS